MKPSHERKTALPEVDPELLERALTHRSFANDPASGSNERLEFLGDSVLGLVVAELLFERFPDWDQGRLSKARAFVVMEGTLADAALCLGLNQKLRLGPGEDSSGGRSRPSILSDVFEAVIAAIYLSSGMSAVRALVSDALAEALERVADDDFGEADFKSRLQEAVQAESRTTPAYRVTAESGPPHNRRFVVEVCVGGKPIGEGAGRSKKEAEQAAARQALENLES